jgi:uncharacterized protein (TIGR03000 family)
MLRKWLTYLGIPAVTLAGVLLMTPTVSAQRFGFGSGYGGYGNGFGMGRGYGYGYGSPYFGNNYYGGSGWNNGFYNSNYPGWNNYSNNYGPGWNRYPNTTYGYQPNYASGGQYVMPSNQTAFYSGDANRSLPEGAALVTVHVPPDAQLWFEDHQTQQQGPFRQFVTPPLEKNQNYSYNVRARWTENGQPVDRTRKVSVHAGEQMNVDLLRDAATQRGYEGTTDPNLRNDLNRNNQLNRTNEVVPVPTDRNNVVPATPDNLNRSTNPLPSTGNPGGTSGTIPPAPVKPPNPGTNNNPGTNK